MKISKQVYSRERVWIRSNYLASVQGHSEDHRDEFDLLYIARGLSLVSYSRSLSPAYEKIDSRVSYIRDKRLLFT